MLTFSMFSSVTPAGRPPGLITCILPGNISTVTCPPVSAQFLWGAGIHQSFFDGFRRKFVDVGAIAVLYFLRYPHVAFHEFSRRFNVGYDPVCEILTVDYHSFASPVIEHASDERVEEKLSRIGGEEQRRGVGEFQFPPAFLSET